MNPFKKDDAAKLQTEVDRLEKKRTTLAGRLVAAQSAEVAAIENRRKFLIDGDDADVSKAAQLAEQIATAQRDRIAIEGAIEELDRLIAEGKAAVIAARESAAREKRASEIETKIKKLEPLAATAEKQFEALVATLERIAAEADDPALDVRQYVELQGHGARLQATALVAASLAESIFKDAPDLLSVTKTPAGMFARASLNVMTRRHGGLSVDLPIDRPDGPQEFTPLKLSGALSANLVDPLRTAVAEILSGERPITSAKTMIEADDDAEPVFDWRWLVFVKPARWQDWRGEMIEQADSRALVPLPVFEAAVKAGVAFDDDAPEAVAQIERRYQAGVHHPSTKLSKAAAVDLDVKWPKTERAAA